MKKAFLTPYLVFVFVLSFSQVNIPINKREYDNYNREAAIIASMRIDLAQTWLYIVKDNLVSSNKVLVQEVYFTKAGLPEKIFYFNEDSTVNSFSIIKYNFRNFPFEEIRYTSDSSLIDGILYEYNRNGFLSKQIFYDNKANVIRTLVYENIGDTIMVTSYKNDSIILFKDIIIFNDGWENGTVKKLLKLDKNNSVIENSTFVYNEFDAIRSKITYDAKNQGVIKEFFYDDNGAVIRTVTKTDYGIILNDSSFEYDSYGNVKTIIDYNPIEKMSKLFVINYLSKTK
jgi:antitoxin component YwqK of YwqJK toxin-antitoxin module